MDNLGEYRKPYLWGFSANEDKVNYNMAKQILQNFAAAHINYAQAVKILKMCRKESQRAVIVDKWSVSE